MRSGTLLALLGVAVVAAFAAQRSCSVFLAVEAHAEQAASVAARTGLSRPEVMALWELYDDALDNEERLTRARELAELRDELGDVLLGVLALRGRRDLALRLRREWGYDRERLHQAIRRERDAVEDAVRFAEVAERFASRGHA